MKTVIPAILLILFGGIFYTMSDMFFKAWVLTNKTQYLILGLVPIIIGETLLAFAYRTMNMAVATSLMIIVNIILLTIVTYFVFHEQATMKQNIGLLLSIVAFILLI